MGRKTISDQLREAIKTCGKTRYQISQESGIDEAALSKFMNEKVGLSLPTIDKLCECIGAELVIGPGRVARSKKKGR
jgi:transcriptional regulator with XRE-family HTH domain